MLTYDDVDNQDLAVEYQLLCPDTDPCAPPDGCGSTMRLFVKLQNDLVDSRIVRVNVYNDWQLQPVGSMSI
jgi:hypothetical protein